MSTTKKIHLKKENTLPPHDNKPTLMQLRRSLGSITSRQVAELAGVPLREEYLMEIGQPVTRDFAERIMGALSTLAEKQYELADVDLLLRNAESSTEETLSGLARTAHRRMQ